jgi:hypothetical protein
VLAQQAEARCLVDQVKVALDVSLKAVSNRFERAERHGVVERGCSMRFDLIRHRLAEGAHPFCLGGPALPGAAVVPASVGEAEGRGPVRQGEAVEAVLPEHRAVAQHGAAYRDLPCRLVET